MRVLIALTLLLMLQVISLADPSAVRAARCGMLTCYGKNSWEGGPGTWSGGVTSMTVAPMTCNTLQDIMNTTMWIIGDIPGTWVEGGVAVGAPPEGAPAYTQVYYAGQQNHQGVYRVTSLGVVPFNDIDQWANVYIFNNFNATWSVVVESLNLGALYIRGNWEGNNMRAFQQQIGIELSNAFGPPEAYADLTYYTNTNWRHNDGIYEQQRGSGLGLDVDDPPFAAGWINRPEDYPGGLFYTRTR